MTRHLIAAALIAWAFAHVAHAQGHSMTAGELAHELDRLARTGRVLYVAAHPDDENTRLLAWLANERHLTVTYLSMTRGGGGQNLIGTEQGELLDVIRTHELLAARRIDGARQRFTRMRDFGFSKSTDETLAIWGREEALADVVWAIRTVQPDVIVTRFDERAPNHGHHTASAVLAREAFSAAADPGRFPEQLEAGASPWQALRIVNNHAPWRQDPAPEDALAIDVGGYDSRLGLSYGELAARSRSEHKSQGFGVRGERGPLIERLIHVAGEPARKDLLEGVDVTWGRFGRAAKPFAKALAEARSKLERDRPERAIPALLKAHRALDALPDDPRTRDARRSLERVIGLCAGLFVRATAPAPTAVPGSEIEVSLEVVMRRPAGLALRRVVVPGRGSEDVNEALGLNEPKVSSRVVAISSDAAVSLLYWLRERAHAGRYTVDEPALIGAPEGPAVLNVEVELIAGGRTLRMPVPVEHAWTDRVHGERVRSFAIVPPATVTPERASVMIPQGRTGSLVMRVRAGADGIEGTVLPGLPQGWSAVPKTHAVTLPRAGDEVTVRFDVRAPEGAEAVVAQPSVTVGGRTWAYREDVIDYPHIPVELVLRPSRVRVVPLPLQVPGGLVGYVQGSGDTVEEALSHVGVQVETIDDETLRSGELSRFQAIVVGIRAYNTRAALRASHARLMKYVEDGGTVLVQYNVNNRWSRLEQPVGPFPLEIGDGRVTDESAAVSLVVPEHPLVLGPNPLGPSDLAGWVQERGLYFATTWDGRYQPLFGMADPGEAPLLGSTLVARYGKGRYVYTGLSFFRQLPAGVPGAYRLFANLISGN